MVRRHHETGADGVRNDVGAADGRLRRRPEGHPCCIAGTAGGAEGSAEGGRPPDSHSAMRDSLPLVELRGCVFHFTQVCGFYTSKYRCYQYSCRSTYLWTSCTESRIVTSNVQLVLREETVRRRRAGAKEAIRRLQQLWQEYAAGGRSARSHLAAGSRVICPRPELDH